MSPGHDKTPNPNPNFDPNQGMMRTLAAGNQLIVRDVLFETCGQHPVTFGADEAILTPRHEIGSQQSLDYIFEVTHRCKGHISREERVYVVAASVEPYFVEGSAKVTQLSDHWAVQAILQVPDAPTSIISVPSRPLGIRSML